jgi:hypothetical protein
MNQITQPAQFPHNLHYSSAMLVSARRPLGSHTVADKGFGLVGAVGVEPTTNGLKGRCSTTELRP